MGKIESRYLSIENHLRNTGIEKYISSVEISLLKTKKFEISKLILI
jgi:hypothetical protein